MIDRLNELTLKLLKTNVSIVLVFYASGFLSFLAYYRVLGLPYVAGNLQLYTELAGRNVIFILQSFIFFITQPHYFFEHRDALNWVGGYFYVWLIVLTLSLLIAAILRFAPATALVTAIRHSPFTLWLRLGLLAVAVLSSLHIETQALYAKNVLQPSNISPVYKEKHNISVCEKLKKKTCYEKRENLASKLNSNENTPVIKEFFVPQSADKSGNDGKRTDSLSFIVLIAAITAIMLVAYRQHVAIKWLIFFYAFAQAVLIPFNYGILGSNYEYPVLSLEYTQKGGADKVVQKKGVFLLAKSDKDLIIYDRLNFFEISYVPQSSVLRFEQLFTGSPFSNCGDKNKSNKDGGFKPCEMYVIKQ